FNNSFTYMAGSNIEMLIEYVQPAGQIGDIRWFYNSDAAVPAYVPNSTKYILSDSANFPGNMTTLSNVRKPTVRFNFPFPINVAIERPFGQELANLQDSFAPGVRIKNTGVNTASTVTITATGPSGYLSTKQVNNLASDS